MSEDFKNLIEPLIIGNRLSGNYIEIGLQGEIKLFGNARFWIDELQSLIGERLNSPAGNIEYNYSEGTVDFQDDAGLSDYVVMNTQINHQWEEKIVIPHIHWFQNQNQNVNWLMAYRWQNNGKLKTEDWSYRVCQNPIFSYESDTLVNICNFGILNAPDNVETSSILQLRLIRDTNNDSGLFEGVDQYVGNAEALNYDIHKYCNRLGTTQEYK